MNYDVYIYIYILGSADHTSSDLQVYRCTLSYFASLLDSTQDSGGSDLAGFCAADHGWSSRSKQLGDDVTGQAGIPSSALVAWVHRRPSDEKPLLWLLGDLHGLTVLTVPTSAMLE